jgi:folate-binding protein YgfZ
MPVTLNAEELESLRIEAGMPGWGLDLDENTIPVEAGLERRAISYEKGCYIGQETIARIKTYGHVNRELVQLRLAAPVERGAPVMSGDRDVGRITSVVGLLALAFVRRELAKRGVVVTVGGNQAEVIKLCGE